MVITNLVQVLGGDCPPPLPILVDWILVALGWWDFVHIYPIGHCGHTQAVRLAKS